MPKTISLEVSLLCNIVLRDVSDHICEALEKRLKENGSLATGDIPDEIYDRFERAVGSAIQDAQDDAEVVDLDIV